MLKVEPICSFDEFEILNYCFKSSGIFQQMGELVNNAKKLHLTNASQSAPKSARDLNRSG